MKKAMFIGGLLLATAAFALGSRSTGTSSGAEAPLSLNYVANMGVLVGSGGTRVLVDALFDKPNPDYRAPEPEVLDKIIKGEAPYDGVRLALVTHNHPDHFAAGVAVRFLESRPETVLVAPADAVAEMRKAVSDWTRLEPRVVSLDLENRDFRRLTAAGIPITAVRTLHSGDLESPMNLMYLFEIDGRRIFHEGDSNGKPAVFNGFGLESAPVDLAVVHFWFPLEPNMAKYLQEVFQPDHIALGHLPIRLESDAPGKIDMVRRYYKDLTLLLPGLPTKVLKVGTPTDAKGFFGQAPPGAEAVMFAAEIHSPALCPHGQLAFALDGSGAFWSSIALEGRQQTIYWSAFDGKTFSPPVVAPFAAEAGNGGPAFSPDGRRLYFSLEIPGPDATSPKTTAIAHVERSGSGWTKPVRIESTADTRMTKGQVSVARSGNIYFSGRILTERAPAIFVSRFIDGEYSAPEKLAGPIADVRLAADPWIDPDERFLLVSFSPADGPPTLTDLGICSRQSDGAWGKPVRLSGPVNTPAFERFASFSSDGKFLFFVRSSSPQFVGDQAHFFWIETKDIPELRAKGSGWSEAKREFAFLPGLSLGQKQPGMTPEIFAPGEISRDGIQMKLTMSADGSEILYTERDPATNAVSFIIRRRAGDSWSEPIVLPYSREYMDIEPSLSPDGKKILFVSNRPESGEGEPKKMPDIWMAENISDQWGTPVRLGPPIRADDDSDIEAHPAFLSDGGIYFMRQSGKNRRLFQAARRGDWFDAPVPLPLKEDLLAGQFSGPCLSPDGRTLLMHSRQEGGFGNWDLYAAFKDEAGGWSELKNIGPVVNTDKPESSPTFSPDGRSLFFTRETDIYWVSAQVIDELRPRGAGRGTSR